MGLDPLSPIAPARVRILLLPLGKIKRDRFLSFVDRLEPEKLVRLGDISPDARPNRNMFSPLAFPTGIILYDLTTSLPPVSHLAMSPFELHREPSIIICIADGTELGNGSGKGNLDNGTKGRPHSLLRDFRELDQALEDVRDQYPKALVHQVFIFDFVQAASAKLPEGLVPIPPPGESKFTTMKTVMCDISSIFLAEMTTLARSIQGMATIESPNQSRARRSGSGYSWPSGNDTLPRRNSQYSVPETENKTRSPTDKNSRSQVRMSMPAQFHSSASDSSQSASTSRPSTPKGSPFDEKVGSRSPENSSLSQSSSGILRDLSRDRISVQGFGSGSELSRNKAKGRTAVVIGALYLQAGRWGDSVRESEQGALLARVSSDHLWHAKALENILVGMLMLAWVGLDFQIPQICYSAADKAPYHTPSAAILEQPSPTSNRLVSLQNLSALLPELLEKVLGLYERAANRAGESLPQLPFSETAIRFSKVLASVHLAGGKLDDDVLQLIVMGIPFRQPPNTGTTRLNIHPTRAVVVGILFRAFPTASAEELSVVDHALVLSGIASVLDTLGYYRKKAMVMRELVAILIPGLVRARMVGAAEMGIHPAAGLAALTAVNGSTNGAGALELGEGDVEHGIDDLLSLIGRIYGVVSFEPLVKVTDQPTDAKHIDDSDEAVIARVLDNAAARAFGGQTLKMNVLRACINLSEALPDFHGVMKFTADLLRTAGSGVAPGPRSEDASPFMTRDEQVRLGANISRTVDAARKLGLRNLEAEYWDEFLVRGVDLESTPMTRTPIPHNKNELSGGNTTAETGERNPFIYNPFVKKPDASSVNRLLVAGESAIFKVTLQNPFEFEIEIESIQLEADGIGFTSTTKMTVIGPYRSQILSIPGTPLAAGPLTIKGCIVKVRGCRERRFPIFVEPWAPKSELKIKASGLAVARKQTGRPISTASEITKGVTDMNKPKIATFSLNVIEKQPVVVVKATSLSQSAAMVLEGERQTFSITLQNLSTVTPVDLLLFSLQDSTQAPLQAALNNRDASPAELYEYELILSRKQALRWIQDDEKAPYIAPGGTATFRFELLGKPGLTSATILVNYTYLGVPRAEVEDKFHTRQASLPITITVNAGVELARMDILPLAGNFPDHIWPKSDSTSGGGFERINPEKFCLMLIDLRNSWPKPLRVRFELPDGYNIDEEVLPGNISRVVFPVRRIFLDDPFAAIPALDPSRQRQFVVSTGRISADVERRTREAFWYREEMLKTLKGSWKTVFGSQRSGDIELRGLRLDQRMIECIKIDDVEVLLLSGNSAIPKSRVQVDIDDFLQLKARISNWTSQPIYPILRLQPALRNHLHNSALDLSKKLLWDGTLQHIIPKIPPRQSIEVIVSITALCRGEFEISASVEEARLAVPQEPIKEESKTGRPRANTRAMMDAVLGVKERRIWHTREPCILVVRDADSSDEDEDL